jgi:hypothetical protein
MKKHRSDRDSAIGVVEMQLAKKKKKDQGDIMEGKQKNEEESVRIVNEEQSPEGSRKLILRSGGMYASHSCAYKKRCRCYLLLLYSPLGSHT